MSAARMPVIYRVDLTVDAQVASRYEAWLRSHVSDMLQIDGFLDAQWFRHDSSGSPRWTVHYTLRDQDAFDAYLRDHAERMRGEAEKEFAGGFSATRAVLRAMGDGDDPATRYDRLARQLAALLEGERDFTANMANCAALVYENVPGLNWAGFYRRVEAGLVLGPFQGRSACVRIEMGKGVCGSSAAERRTLVVDDVNAFEGHIACDARSRSEVVVPMVKDDLLLGVFDVDSPVIGRFDSVDKAGFESLVAVLLESSDVDASATTI